MRGTIESVERLYSGAYRITLLTNEKPMLESLMNKDVNCSIKQYKAHRSLDANAYYWSLLSKVAEAINISKPYAHNKMLRLYGQYEVYDGKHLIVYIPNTEEAMNKADEDEYVHLKPTSQVKMGNDGEMYRAYKLLKGSSGYDTYEMAKLIDGLVSIAQGMDIETLPPDELNRMKQQWGVDIAKKNKGIAV